MLAVSIRVKEFDAMVFLTFSTNILSNALLIGLISSLIATLITLLASYLYNKWKDKKRYGKLRGIYSEYGYKEGTSEWELKDKPQSNATITYLQKNTLDIEVKSLNKHYRYIWKGQIFMDSEIHGSISWRYI